MADLSVRWGNGGFQEIEGILVMGGGGVDTLLQTMIMLCASCCTSSKTVSTLYALS